MGFRNDAYATVWNVQQEEGKNYTTVELSISRKDKQSGEYQTDFSSKFVRFIGTAHQQANALTTKCRIKLGDIDVSNGFNKETNKSWTIYKVFSFHLADGSEPVAQNNSVAETASPVADDDEPF